MIRYRRSLGALLTCSVTIGVLSCSWISDLVIVNATESPMLAILEIVRPDSSGILATAPGGGDLHSTQWVRLDPSSVQADRGQRRLEITVPPHTALRVDRIANYSGGGGQFYEDRLNLEAIELHGAGAPQHWSRGTILPAFKKKSRFLFVCEYR